MMKVNIHQVYRILGEKYDGAIESLWADKGWDDEVDFNEFLREWTEMTHWCGRLAEKSGIDI